MKFLKVKVLFFAVIFIFLFFFSNDFGLIDVEKTAIITAVAVDLDEEKGYEVTAQIAVPEASEKNTENPKAQISGKGCTVGEAVKNVGDRSGWFPNMQFCNLIIVGEGFDGSNVIKFLDYFSKTLRVQDSAVVVTADGKGKDLLTPSTPLDHISSFALQKILLKTQSFDKDVVQTDIKKFCVGYYSESQSSFTALIKKQKLDTEEAGGGSGGGSGNSGSDQEKVLFDAKNTALYYLGKRVGTLSPSLTLALETLTENIKGTTVELENLNFDDEVKNVLITVFKNKSKLKVKEENGKVKVSVDLTLYCKISDQNSEASDITYEKNTPLPFAVKKSAEKFFALNIEDLFETAKLTNCDFLYLKRKLFEHDYESFCKLKDSFWDNLEYSVSVNVSGQK